MTLLQVTGRRGAELTLQNKAVTTIQKVNTTKRQVADDVKTPEIASDDDATTGKEVTVATIEVVRIISAVIGAVPLLIV